jgi:hypothetical protein
MNTQPEGTENVLVAVALGVVLLTFVLLEHAFAEPLPQPKPPGPGGSCPFGYIASGSYCVPSQGG